MSIRSLPLALILVLAALVAACTGSGGPATTARPSAAASPSAAPSAAPTIVASVQPSAPATSDLASRIPATVGDITLNATTIDPAIYAALNPSRQIPAVLAALGKTPADVEVATALGAVETGSLFIDAVRIKGADTKALFNAFEAAAAKVPGLKPATTTIGQTDVVTWEGSGRTAVAADGDVLFFVQAPTDELVTEALAALS